MFDTKIAIILLDELAVWQKLNVTAFLMSGIIGKHPELIGEKYEDNSENVYLALNQQPTVILEADSQRLSKIQERILRRSLTSALYIKDMFSTYNDEDNRKSVANYDSSDLPIVGIGLIEEKKTVDKITKGAKLHP